MSSLLYIHGFNSSSHGIKGQQLMQLMIQLGLVDKLIVPDLPMEPLKAIAQLEQIIHKLDKPTLVGSSLGGYYATYLAEKYQLKMVLINPVVLPHKTLGKNYLGNENYLHTNKWAIDTVGNILRATYNSDQIFIDNYMKELAKLEVEPPNMSDRYKVWLKAGDEVLDYRFAKDWYKNCDVCIDNAGDHSFADFAERLPQIIEWAGLTNS